jgi:hypothetical protein
MNATTPVAVDGKPKLLDRVRNALRVRHLARSTEKAYVYWCRRYILYHNKRHPLDMGKQEVEAFLTHLAVDRHVSASTQNQAFSALLFLYREALDGRKVPSRPSHARWLRGCGTARCVGPQVPQRTIRTGLAIRVPCGQAIDRSS